MMNSFSQNVAILQNSTAKSTFIVVFVFHLELSLPRFHDCVKQPQGYETENEQMCKTCCENQQALQQ